MRPPSRDRVAAELARRGLALVDDRPDLAERLLEVARDVHEGRVSPDMGRQMGSLVGAGVDER